MTEPRTYSLSEINALDTLDVDALRSMFTIELAGEAFYEGLAERVGNAEAAELLRRNGKEEAGHARRIQRALTIALGDEFVPTPEMLAAPGFPVPEVVSPDLLTFMLQTELDGDVNYERWATNESNPEIARLLRLNGREETIHGERLRQALALLG